MLTPDAVTEIPTAVLVDFEMVTAVLTNLMYEVDDYEGLIVSVEGWLGTAAHVIDAELHRRRALAI